MSNKAIREVWAADLQPLALKLVALRFADFCDDQGLSLFPSLERVAVDCGVTRDYVKRMVRLLKEHGILEVVKPATPTTTPEYRLRRDVLRNMARGTGVPPCGTDGGEQELPPGGEPGPRRGEQESRRGGTRVTPTPEGPVREPSDNPHTVGARSRAARPDGRGAGPLRGDELLAEVLRTRVRPLREDEEQRLRADVASKPASADEALRQMLEQRHWMRLPSLAVARQARASRSGFASKDYEEEPAHACKRA